MTEAMPGVSQTAIGVAMVRAYESSRPDRLFDDPYARDFVRAAPREFVERRRADVDHAQGVPSLAVVVGFSAIIRTRYFDDYLLAAARDTDQVVLLAAGLDTRAYRLDWPPGVRLFEVDLPQILAFKARVLGEKGATPRCERREVAADLRFDWATALTAAGFDPARPTAWLVEGLLIYLTHEEAAALLTTVGGLSADGSRLAFEHSSYNGTARRGLDHYVALWKGGLGPEAPRWLAEHGWDPHPDERVDVARGYGRRPPPGLRGTFITANRTERAPDAA
ncbi:SAM-dependent methyltransferase [Hamadaea tsunoensis]|uniref:SAM-dependent methyltransferase n=1 Tax=Hamadaea tsunoensis TaxID=53368 RepID=UPI001B7FAAF4|nr:SAM-dependent methyltransferase [Hamadaea tsunoensis]